VVALARHCAGGVILGFSQVVAPSAVEKAGTAAEVETHDFRAATPWNHLEAGVLAAMGLPMLVFRERGVRGGIFDVGSADLFVHELPRAPLIVEDRARIRAVMLKWQGRVQARYHGDGTAMGRV
jgi:hypothetical protein